MILYR